MVAPIARVKTQSRLVADIPAGQTIDFDTLPLSVYKSNKYLMQYSNDTEGVVGQLEMATSKKNSDVSDQIYSKVGDNIDVDAQFLISGSDAILRLTNNEAFVVRVVALRFNLF